MTAEMQMLPYYRSVRLLAFALFIALIATAAYAQQRTDFGMLSVQVRPPGAEISIDGERWTRPEGSGPLQIQLSPGTHRVEIRSPGRQSFVRDVTIRAGETLPLNVALTQGEPAGPPPPQRRPAPPPPPIAPPGRIVQATQSEDGPVIAPDFRVSEINHHTGQLFGVYGGWVFAKQLLVGAGGYWQVDSTYGEHLTYGGPVFEWRMFPESAVGVNLHGLIGAGWRYSDYGYYYGPHGGYGYSDPYGPYGWYNEAFFVAEPEAQVVVRLSPNFRLQGGVGYRATSANGMSGVSGSFSVQFGR